MKDMDWSHTMCVARGYGKTTVMIEAAKKIGAALVVRNFSEAKRVGFLGVKAIPFFCASHSRGLCAPILFDPDAVALITAEYEGEIAVLKAELEKLRASKKRRAGSGRE